MRLFFLALRLIVRKPALVPALQDGGLVASDEEKEKKEPSASVTLTPRPEGPRPPDTPPPSKSAPSADSSKSAPSADSSKSAPSADSSAPSAGSLGPQDPVMLLGKWFSKFVGVCCFFSKFVMFLGAFVFLEHEFLAEL